MSVNVSRMSVKCQLIICYSDIVQNMRRTTHIGFLRASTLGAANCIPAKKEKENEQWQQSIDCCHLIWEEIC